MSAEKDALATIICKLCGRGERGVGPDQWTNKPPKHPFVPLAPGYAGLAHRPALEPQGSRL